MKKLRIEVTAEDVVNDACGSSTRCPIALAVRRLFPRRRVEVLRALFGGGARYEVYSVPPAALRKMDKFDGSGDMRPFVFTAEEVE